ncbi:RidA family protein [Neorhizobium sp. T786]|uniref:RidA family protein n=1 Tax=Pseudorhizobium xiangyangii TaxID=2883104 RepID=UPI001CFFE927|nr:RidA family protein [Neorhizobium xiangyangii]MCB5203510.1 RidA family protein [Neorhizobium xiangyangii]
MTEPKIVKLKSGSIYEEKESYSRLVCIDNWILVSNTAGRNYRTREISPDPVAQAKQCLDNIQGALKAVGSDLTDIVSSRIFIPDQNDVPAIMAYIGERLKGIDPQRTINCNALSSPEFRVEMEMTAYRGAGNAPAERRSVSLS